MNRNQTNSIKPTVRRRRRGNADQAGRQALKLLNQAVSHVNGPQDPKAINKDVLITKRIEIAVTGTTPVAITPVKLSTALQGAATFFDKIRVQKVSAYGEAGPAMSIVVDFPGSDGGQFLDRGTQGHLRPQLHLLPGFNLRQTWFGVAATDTIFTASATSGIVQVTIEARSLPGSDV